MTPFFFENTAMNDWLQDNGKKSEVPITTYNNCFLQ